MSNSQLKLVDININETSTQKNQYVAGMPQLAYAGLSENWLLKECGHRHWMGLADLTGKKEPDFHDESGNKSYAAFTAVRIASAKLNTVKENQQFNVTSQVSRAGQARHFSMHDVKSENGSIANIQMLSTFVFRREAGNNQSVTRASFANLSQSEPLIEANVLMQQCKKIRTDDWVEHMGLSRASKATIKKIEFLPCPNNDFNGANFLYFASFQAYVDRAAWAWGSSQPSKQSVENLPSIVNRDLFFYGNINVGDTLKICLCAENIYGMYYTDWCEVYAGNGSKIADVFTQKILAATR